MDTSPRDAALRDLLVATVDAAPMTAPRRRARSVWRPVVAFALAGALTGGTVAVAANAASTATREPGITMLSVTITTPSWIRDDMTLVGDAIVAYDPRGPVSVGERPDGATHLAMNVTCLTPGGRFTLAVDDEMFGSGECSEQDPDKPTRFTYGGTGSAQLVTGGGTHDATVTSTGSIALWLSWVSIPATPEPSAAQQAELADGTVTLEEYQAAFARYRACLQAAGHDVSSLIDLGDRYHWVLMDAVVQSGADEACYGLEFAEVDTIWQGSLAEQ